MHPITNYLHIPAIAYFPSKMMPPVWVEKVMGIAKGALGQLVLSLSLNVAFCAVFGSYFVPPSMATFTVAMGALLTIMAIQAIWQRSHGASRWESAGGHLARASLVNTLTLKLNHLLHELGHAGAALLTYVGANPKIIVNSRQGSTTYEISHGLTRFGKLWGEQRALLFTTAAGLAAPVIVAMAEFAIAYKICDKHPTISEWLNYHGFSQLLGVGIYCSILAYNSSKELLTHDSILLWQRGGIHPLVTLAFVVGLPLAEIALLSNRKPATA